MLKLKQNVMEFLEVTVKPKYLETVVKSIIDNPPKVHEVKSYRIDDAYSEFRQTVDLRLDITDFEEIEDLKPYIWYERVRFNGNPKRYVLVEMDAECCWTICDGEADNFLCNDTTHFMYLKRPE